MRIAKHIKKNNGSTLTLVLFMLFMLSVTAIAVITLTGSELSMSVMTSDRDKALQIAQAGAEKAAQVLDKEVAQAQEDARVESSRVVQCCIDFFEDVTSVDGKKTLNNTIPGTSPFYKVIDNYSNPGEIIILNEEALNAIYENEYKYQFNKLINEWVEKQTDLTKNSNASWHNSKLYNMNATGLNTGDTTDGKYSYADGEVIKNANAYIVSQLGSGTTVNIKSIKLTSTGEYKSPSNGSTYKRSIKAEFGLLTKSENGITEIPISYGKLTRVRVNKVEDPSLLSGKALIAQKNIISLDGLVNVKNGDVVCFGTIPKKDSSIDYDADGYKFGGIMAGMIKESADDTENKLNYKSDIWSNPSFGYSIMDNMKNNPDTDCTLKKNMINTLGINYSDKNHSGSFNIDGDVSTLAYVHSLYNDSNSSIPWITVKGNTFARSIKVESESNFSKAQFKNVYTYDDLRIDGNKSEVKIGKWNDDGTANTDTDCEGTLVGLNTGDYYNQVSSAVIIAGDSTLKINCGVLGDPKEDPKGGIYVGGSTFYNTSTSYNYSSGMSIQKSDDRPVEAFEKSTVDSLDPEKDPRNVFYLYKNDSKKSEEENYTYVTNKNDQQMLKWATYSKTLSGGAQPVEMMEGRYPITDPLQLSPFNVLDKAMHLKHIWDEFWKRDVGKASYFNTGDIIIKPDDGNKLKGWCNGGVTANGQFYGPYGGFTDTNDSYVSKKTYGFDQYSKLMDLFIDNKSDDANRLNIAIPKKKLSDYVSKNVLPINPTEPYLFENTSSNEFMYYSSGNVVLNKKSVDDKSLDNAGCLKGIIYADGDIYVMADTKFKGILIAEGNIVFIGNNDSTTIDIEYDENVVKSLLSEGRLVSRFFNRTTLIMNNPNAIVQTIRKNVVKNIKIISWKEI